MRPAVTAEKPEATPTPAWPMGIKNSKVSKGTKMTDSNLNMGETLTQDCKRCLESVLDIFIDCPEMGEGSGHNKEVPNFMKAKDSRKWIWFFLGINDGATSEKEATDDDPIETPWCYNFTQG